jgi:murein DD-endopeptidase MepM/ murein hydrolase activator NlpD
MRRGYSFMMFSQPEGRSRKFFLSNRAAKVSVTLLAALLLGFVGMFFFYTHFYRLGRKVDYLEKENRRLTEENTKIYELSKRVAELEVVRRRVAQMLGVEALPYDSLGHGGSPETQITSPLPPPALGDRWKPRGKPVDGIISRGYSSSHPGVDLAARTDAPILVTADGVVLDSGYDEVFGNFVLVDHNGKYRTYYGHMSRSAVRKGQGVDRGDILGFVGTTGSSTGPHLHYEVRRENSRLNPVLYLF